MKDLMPQLLDLMLARLTSDEIGDLAVHYYAVSQANGMEEAWMRFTDRYELGNWIYEAAVIAEIDLISLLDDLQNTRQSREQEAAVDRAEREHEYRRMVGAE